jgi:hypothetical protein
MFGPQRACKEHAVYDKFMGWKALTRGCVPESQLPVPVVPMPPGWTARKRDGRARFFYWLADEALRYCSHTRTFLMPDVTDDSNLKVVGDIMQPLPRDGAWIDLQGCDSGDETRSETSDLHGPARYVMFLARFALRFACVLYVWNT